MLSKEHSAFAFTNDGNPSSAALMVFVHGWGCGDAVFEAQVGIFRQSRGAISAGLRNDDRNDAPHENYAITSYAADIAWQCNVIGLHKLILVGDSKDGNVSLEATARNPEATNSIVRIDSVFSTYKKRLKAMS